MPERDANQRWEPGDKLPTGETFIGYSEGAPMWADPVPERDANQLAADVRTAEQVAATDSAYVGRRLMVSGSRARYWTKPHAVKRAILSRLREYPLDVLVMHGAEPTGVDAWTQAACEITGHDYLPFPPHKSIPSPARYHERNDRMLDRATEVLAFWEGLSPGTRSVIKKARERGLYVRVDYPETCESYVFPALARAAVARAGAEQ